METYDVIVVGAGSGGMAAAKKAAGRGASVAVVESRTVGGTCVARGCMPKKFLVLAAEKLRRASASGPSGLDTQVKQIRWEAIIDREREVVSGLIDANREGLERFDAITVIEGRATLEDAGTVRVGDRTLSGDVTILATGLHPHRPPIEGADLGMTSDEFLENRGLPDSMAVVGGGYVGVEFAGVLNAFGTDVTVFQRPDHLIPGHDREVADNLEDALAGAGIDVNTGAEVQAVRQTEDGFAVHHEASGGEAHVQVDEVLVAAGRRPNTDGLGLGDVGVELDSQGFVVVDESLRTSVDDVYAVGDVNGRMMFTPVAIAEGKRAAVNALEGRSDPVNYEAVPTAVFSSPPIGSVGLSESAARDREGNVAVARKSFTPFEATVLGEETDVFIKLIYADEDRRLVGLHVLGPHGPEIVQGFAPAMRKGLYQEDLRDFPGIHPTIAEEIFSTKSSG